MSNPYRIQQDTVNNLEGSLDDKQDKLTAGTGITIDENNVISAEGGSAPVWGNITGDLSNQTDLNTALNGKQNTLTAGTGIDITNNVISSTVNSAVWGNITGTLSNQTDLSNELLNKADKATTLAGYGITNAYTKEEVDGKIVGAYHVKPSVNTVSDLPLSNNVQGDCRNVLATGDNYVWTSSSSTGSLSDWDKLSGIVDLSAYRTAVDQDAIDDTLATKEELNTKQDTLTAGTGIDITNNVISSTVNSAVWGNITGSLSNQTDLSTALGAKADETELNSHINNSTVHVSSTDKSNWNGKQDALDTDQLASVNSGITSTKVGGYDSHVINTSLHVSTAEKATWNGKQDALDTDQLAAVNSGVTSTKVSDYDSHLTNTNLHVTSTEKATWNGKQNALTAGTGIDIDNNVISCTVTGAVWGNITGSLSNQTDLNTALTGKASASDLTTHTSDTNIHVSSTDKTAWNAKTVVTIRRW